jgi:hypothetical protein
MSLLRILRFSFKQKRSVNETYIIFIAVWRLYDFFIEFI